ncbi:MAG: right-handed parallel beta-helix repeat-containing protein [Verrucomicrobiae bacterium]|nr:right-handed parallel beta-helix repeat-containing protein [Verrucomicrobiae bacterium]
MRAFRSALEANRNFWLVLTLAIIGYFTPQYSSRAATIVVTNLAKSGAGTLRTLLPTAKNGDVITFAVTGVITNMLTGGFTISNSISIVGPGPDLLTITGTNWYSGFQVNNGATSSISGLTFYRCTSAINNSANLTVSNCVFSGCYRGGGINNASNLTVSACTFTDCRGGYGSGGYFNGSENPPGTSAGSGANGGAIVNSGNMSARNCQFLNNTAGWGGDGTPGYVAIYLHQFTAGGNGGNGGSGGAVYDTGTMALTNCTFGGNTSGYGGSGGYGSSGFSTIYPPTQTYPGPGWNGGNAGNAGNGSAVWSATGARFVSCTFYNNSTGSGGNGGNGGDAIMPTPSYYQFNGGYAGNAGSGTLYCTGTCQLVACTFYNNNTGNGGSGGSGGAGVNYAGYMGSSGNMGNGANAGNGGSGGAIFGPRNSNTNFTLLNVLIAGNACSYAGSAGSAGARVVSATGPAGTNGLSAIDGTGPDLSGFFASRGHNFVSLGDGSTGFTNNVRSDIVGSGSAMDAMVNGLADNGGPVQTCALQPGSPAVDAGDDSLPGSPWYLATDARGYPRKSGAHVDIGAYELGQLSLPVVANVTMTPNGTLLSVTNTPGVTFEVLGTTDLTLPVAYWNFLGQMSEVSPGVFQWTDTSAGNYDSQFYLLQSP